MAQLKEGSVIKKSSGDEVIATLNDLDGIDAINAETVNGHTVNSDVPANAKFTDTNTITTINGKTGAISKADIVALGIPSQDTVYSHPASHPASIITQDTNNRFVSDNEKDVWNGKQDALGFTPVNTTDSRLSDARTPTAHNHDGTYQPIDADLTAIAGLTGTTGLLRKTAADTWSLDTTALGDMTVAIYGGSASGVVAKADSLKETRTGATEKVWVGTKAQYDAIVTKDAGTTYITTDETYGSYISLDETGHILASYMPLTVSAHIASTSNPHGVTKSQVGLGNVNNTADIDKPISLYVQNALDGKAALNHTHSTYALLNHTHSTYAPINNPTFTGVAKATGNTSYTTSQLRNIFLSTIAPTSGDGVNGDIWIVYE